MQDKKLELKSCVLQLISAIKSSPAHIDGHETVINHAASLAKELGFPQAPIEIRAYRNHGGINHVDAIFCSPRMASLQVPLRMQYPKCAMREETFSKNHKARFCGLLRPWIVELGLTSLPATERTDQKNPAPKEATKRRSAEEYRDLLLQYIQECRKTGSPVAATGFSQFVGCNKSQITRQMKDVEFAKLWRQGENALRINRDVEPTPAIGVLRQREGGKKVRS